MYEFGTKIEKKLYSSFSILIKLSQRNKEFYKKSFMSSRIVQESQRKYQKIGYETRKLLIHKVHVEKMKIKYAGEDLGLNESTAKRIIKMYRTEGKVTKFKEENEALSINQKPENDGRVSDKKKELTVEKEKVQETEIAATDKSQSFQFEPADYYQPCYNQFPQYPYFFQYLTYFSP